MNSKNLKAIYNRMLPCLLSGVLILAGCSNAELVNETNSAANDTVFKQDKWHADAALELKIPAVQTYVQSILAQLSKQAKHPGIYTVTVTDDPMVNGAICLGGFCTPGEIIVTRGMLNAASNEAEIACYLGHEIGHYDLQSEDQPQAKLSRLTHMTVDQATGYIPDPTGGVYIAKKHAQDMWTAHYSRKQEEAADEYGATLAAKAGYNPFALVGLFDRLSRLVKKGPLESLARLKESHKALDSRASHLNTFLQKEGLSQRGKEDLRRYQTALAPLTTYGGTSPSVVTKAPPEAYAELAQLHTEIEAFQKSKKRMPLVRYAQILRRLAELKRKYGVMGSSQKITHVNGVSTRWAFMEEAISLALPLWKLVGDPSFSKSIDSELLGLSHLPFATSLEGIPYHLGSKNLDAIDCSGLIQTVYADYFGAMGPNGEGALNANSQFQKLVADGNAPIGNLKDLQMGDLVYFHQLGSDTATHAAIVNGVDSTEAGTTIHIIAASPGAGQVTEQTLRSDGSLSNNTQFLGGGRPTTQ